MARHLLSFTSECMCANEELELKRKGQLLLNYFETKTTSTLAIISGNSYFPKQVLFQITDFGGEAVYFLFPEVKLCLFF